MAPCGTPDRVALRACYGHLLVFSLSSCFAHGFWSFQLFSSELDGKHSFLLVLLSFVFNFRRRLFALLFKLIVCFCLLNQTFRLMREAFFFPFVSNSTKAYLTFREAFLLFHFVKWSKTDYTLREAFFIFLIFQMHWSSFYHPRSV